MNEKVMHSHGSNVGKFDSFFEKLTGKTSHSWQQKLGEPSLCENRLIRIPTGWGKTLGVLAAWTWHRVVQKNNDWPRRLVWCLPMRVLVEQTESEVRSALQQLDILWDGQNTTHDGKVGVHLLMGGANAGRWYLYPECDVVLIGTQDMLLSRALNRGYASPRARWPMEFGLLNHDALWVMDEVQLMDTGLATSGQLQVFRDKDLEDGKLLRPCFTWWMSATLQRSWLSKSPDTKDLVSKLDENMHSIGSHDRTGPLWSHVIKSLTIEHVTINDLAHKVSQLHQDNGCGKNGPTLIVLNTVKRAVEIWKKLKKDKALKDTDIHLIHSRFRPAERQTWRQEFLNRNACGPDTNRIIVSTQVVEAGVDISAFLLITELAPWPSLVQRFGRCARWGGKGQVFVADLGHKDDKKAAPYSLDALNAARESCETLKDVGQSHLERFEEEHQEWLPRLYPYEPKHLLLRHELDELFDTSPDLSGADIDISRFIRAGKERDVSVFWAEVKGDRPLSTMKPRRDELSSVPFLAAQEWLCGKGKRETLKGGLRAWVWDWLCGEWRTVKRRDIFPGQTLLVESRTGGYCPDSGWDSTSRRPVKPVPIDEGTASSKHNPEDDADGAEEDESLSMTSSGWQTIASHGLQVAMEVERITEEMVPSKFRMLLHLAGRWHDLGKAHAAFQASIRPDSRPERHDIAKAPKTAWQRDMYRIDNNDQRRGFRHELVSTLGLFGVLQRHEPQHPALLGPWGSLLKAMGKNHRAECSNGIGSTEPTEIEREILQLSGDEFDLTAYLVCAHHGKVRMAWHPSPADQENSNGQLRIRGVQQGDHLPQVVLADAHRGFHPLPATSLDLSPAEAGLSPYTGRSWTERMLTLVDRHRPFTLAWLEALLRAADQRASSQPAADTLLQDQEKDDAGC